MTDSENETSPAGEHICVCACHGCKNVFEADTVGDLASKLARHWNSEHPGDLKHQYDLLETEEYGGSHVHEDVYQVRRREYYITAYDVLAVGRSQPISEEFATPGEPRACTDCWRYTGTFEVDAVKLDSPDLWDCEWRCEYCHEGKMGDERPDYEAEKEQSHQLTDFDRGDA